MIFIGPARNDVVRSLEAVEFSEDWTVYPYSQANPQAPAATVSTAEPFVTKVDTTYGELRAHWDIQVFVDNQDPETAHPELDRVFDAVYEQLTNDGFAVTRVSGYARIRDMDHLLSCVITVSDLRQINND